MRFSEFKAKIREIVREKIREEYFDSQGNQRVGIGLPQTIEVEPIEEAVGCGCGCGCGGKKKSKA